MYHKALKKCERSCNKAQGRGNVSVRRHVMTIRWWNIQVNHTVTRSESWSRYSRAPVLRRCGQLGRYQDLWLYFSDSAIIVDLASSCDKASNHHKSQWEPTLWWYPWSSPSLRSWCPAPGRTSSRPNRDGIQCRHFSLVKKDVNVFIEHKIDSKLYWMLSSRTHSPWTRVAARMRARLDRRRGRTSASASWRERYYV